ncbi:N-acetylglucosamine-binding protein GbpA [Pseudomonas sp. PSKL.D1]|uniref:N-acetylglucosamine-binding protein GbpA n=1 Tax=Pseudomonas sp. PSKL.D1 TaxID=3029060 RepID=UPI0023810140|nr:N-acetylglucosamine-binding protein GbpA [Pseudomonas sp. PSKL.D1]WDY58354.1 N-acetylglucosamine-binding protein GbpA [Pseudomonas sp. PSKL.D1]
MKQCVVRTGLLAGGALAALSVVGFLPNVANAHGYLSDPPSRDYACRLRQNTGCGAVVDEPQSVGETNKGYPASGPADGKIASGGISRFAAIDEQSANRWTLMQIDNPAVEFDWYYTKAHLTTGWEYFISKPGWNRNAPLARSTFDSKPFCTVDGKGEFPRDTNTPGPGREKHACIIPADRTGHHVILGVWTVADTVNAFYKVIDVDIQIEGGPAPEWRQVSSIDPHRDLQVGDKVKARAFVGSSEDESYSAEISIGTAEEAIAANWSYKLAAQLNQTQTLIRAGHKDSEGIIAPIQGPNIIYAKQESGVTGYELEFDGEPGDDAYMHVHGLKPEYVLEGGKATLDFSVMTNRDLEVRATLYNSADSQVGFASGQVDSTTRPFSLHAESSAGEHLLKIVGTDEDSRVLLQQEHPVLLRSADGGEHDFVYPQSIDVYREGTRVLQPKDGGVYECLPFPVDGWCRIYSSSANQYEPGVGSDWQSAWIRR